MPKKVLVLGPAPGEPVVAAVQAIQALRSEGCEVVLIDPNAAALTTDRDLAHRTYLEPVTRESAERVIAAEKPDAVLATTAGIDGAKLALSLGRPGLQVIGASFAEGPRAFGSAEGLIVDAIVVRESPPPSGEGGRRPGEGERPSTHALLIATLEHPDSRGVHSADSVAIVPARLSPAQLDQLTAAAAKALTWVGSNGGVVRCAVGAEITVLEVTPCFTHECGLATRFSGIPVAGIATKLSLGRTFAELELLPHASHETWVRLPVFDAGSEALGRARRSRGHVIGTGADLNSAMSNAWAAMNDGGGVPPLPPSGHPLPKGEGIAVAAASTRVALIGGDTHESDWACVHAGRALISAGFAPVLLSPNPDSLAVELRAVLGQRFVPLTPDAVIAACRDEGVSMAFVQAGGDAALELAAALDAAGICVLGTSASAIDRIHGDVLSSDTTDSTLVDLELIADHTGKVIVAGVLQQVEPALVHPSDAASTLPPHSLKPEIIERLKDAATAFAREHRVIGLLSLRCAVRGKSVAIVEASPRASRTLPFVAKTTGVPLMSLAVRVALGDTLQALGVESDPEPRHHAVKEAVLPLTTGAVRLGPSSRSIGGVMSMAESLPAAFANSQLAAGTALPRSGQVLLALSEDDNPSGVDLARRLNALGFEVVASPSTHGYLASKRLSATLAAAAQPAMLIDTGSDDRRRREAVMAGVPHFSTVEAARLLVSALEARAAGERAPRPLQAFFEEAR